MEDKNQRLVIIILLLIIIILLSFFIMSNNLGKIGYVATSGKNLELIEITQNDIGWNMLEELNIFRNAEFDNKNIIAPNSKGTYSFFVDNITNQNLIYDVQLREVNENNINMKYRLKLENVYVAGNKDTWLNIKEVNLENIILAANSKNLYTLEWYWENNDNQDTKIGSLNYANYTLRIKIGAQTYEKTVGEK